MPVQTFNIAYKGKAKDLFYKFIFLDLDEQRPELSYTATDFPENGDKTIFQIEVDEVATAYKIGFEFGIYVTKSKIFKDKLKEI